MISCVRFSFVTYSFCFFFIKANTIKITIKCTVSLNLSLLSNPITFCLHNSSSLLIYTHIYTNILLSFALNVIPLQCEITPSLSHSSPPPPPSPLHRHHHHFDYLPFTYFGFALDIFFLLD